MVSELFADLQGQPLATQVLQSALTHQRLAPAYLFSGPDGVGRRLGALRFMEGVLTGGGPDPRERRRLEERNHPDLLWVEPTYSHQGRLISRSEAEAAGVNRRTPPQVRLEQIRDLGRFLARQPLESPRGLVVLEQPEAMAEGAANALLKTLEEPGHGLLILLSAAPDRLLTTIRSRCQQIRFTRLPDAAMQTVLAQLPEAAGHQALEVAAAEPELVALASGSPGALIEHVRVWGTIPEGLRERLKHPPQTPLDALALARDVCEQLEGEQQLWLISWWQTVLWRQQLDRVPVERLNRLRQQLLSFVQPRLAWEVTLLNLISVQSS
ncbi:DNA polymerase III subunit delta' [Synechococcus sp. CS-197]|uniref:DNA polymerase III subunit delta' n=1 Tax=Synechococcus sp. CS-197 TaxID=2847985 RepID=UPI00015252C3|nr:DNA polymerase III subunit delta' [Synechococcus sp. CS-197]MCT0250131.1 DNA polymerase III subunit delta' [Synechococcus sp. CS-197]CAK24669.1 DNA polymerase III delta prime subunit [Synechococcus sp. WH 7803]